MYIKRERRRDSIRARSRELAHSRIHIYAYVCNDVTTARAPSCDASLSRASPKCIHLLQDAQPSLHGILRDIIRLLHYRLIKRPLSSLARHDFPGWKDPLIIWYISNAGAVCRAVSNRWKSRGVSIIRADELWNAPAQNSRPIIHFANEVARYAALTEL